MEFGITIKPDSNFTLTRIRNLVSSAEKLGFRYAWLYDSHVLRRDPYPLLTMLALQTTSIHLGTCVTNPVTRHPSVTASTMATLQEISGGRMHLGIGRGDSPLRLIGQYPASPKQVEDAVALIRSFMSGHSFKSPTSQVQYSWSHSPLPIWIAAYGPKMLRLAGMIADGVILQLADLEFAEWCINFVRDGCRAANRPIADVKIMIAAPVLVSSERAEAIDKLRWFSSVVANHAKSLVRTYGADGLPKVIVDLASVSRQYDYLRHGNIGTPNGSSIPDEIVERLCIVGPLDYHVRRIESLENLGVGQINLYMMNDDEEDTIESYGRKVLRKE